MDKNPYKFNENNPRIVEKALRCNMVYYGAGAIFLGSLYMYNRLHFRKDGNLLYAMAFGAASAPSAYAISDFVFGSAETEAALMNNESERKH